MQNSIDRVNELPDPDKADILTHVQHLTDNRRSILTITRNISALIIFRDKLEKSFRHATVKDMRAAFTKIEKEGWKTKKGEVREYSSWADKKFRDVIKKFYRVVYGNDEDYPDTVKWIKTQFTKDESIKKLDMNKCLSKEQRIKLIDITEGLQRKALLAIGYELGARPGELLALTNLNLHEDEGDLFCTINESKTDERVIKIVEYKSLLKQWLSNHPLKHQQVYPLWISEATNYKNRRLGIAGAEKIAEEMIPKVDPNKYARLYTLRHSRATFLARCGFSETQLCLYFGWKIGSDQPKTYIHLSGRDLNQAISALYGNKEAQKQMKVTLDNCLQCKEELYPNAPFCAKCGHSTSMTDSCQKGIKKDVEKDAIEDIKLQLQNFKIEMQEQMNYILNITQKERHEIDNLKPNKQSMLLKNGIKTENGEEFEAYEISDGEYQLKMENIAAVVERTEDGKLRLAERFIEQKVKHNQDQFSDKYPNKKPIKIEVLNDQS